MKKKVRVLTAALLIMLISVLPVFVSALEVDEGQELDIETGEPVSEKQEKNKNVVTIANGITYDKSKKLYYYEVNGNQVGMNYPDGVITTKKIRVEIPGGMGAQLFVNGSEIIDPDFTEIKDPGSYVVLFRDQNETSLHFTIVNDVTGAVNEYRMPSGFVITAVTKDGEKIDNDGYRQLLTEEGRYAIEYQCRETKVSYTLNVEIDHTPPTLKLEAVDEAGYAKGPVSLEDLKKDTKLTVLLNGEKTGYSNKELTKSGTYDLTLEDEAGNITTYHFVIRVYFNVNSVVLFVLLAALIAALVIYIIRSRKKLRVR